jgi:NitT/TauT family transport system permease protein
MTRWFRVFIPAAMPSIITGLRLGLGQALILVVAAEFVSADRGMGRFIWDSWQILDISRMFMGLGIVLMFGGTAAVLGNIAEQRLIPWHRR